MWSTITLPILRFVGGAGVGGLTRGLATLPQGGPRSLQWSETVMEDPQEDPLAVHCSCVCSGNALLGGLLWVTRSRERDLLSVLLIYPRIFFCIFIVYCHIVFCCMLFIECWLLWFSCHTCPPFPFGRICFVVLVMRKSGESSWSGQTFRLYIWKFSMCTATRTSSYSPVGSSVFFYT